MAKLLLVHPVFLGQDRAERDLASPYFPLGLLYLAGYVRNNGHQVAVFDGTFSGGDTDFIDRLDRECPDVVGISSLQPSRDRALRLAVLAADHGPLVVVGGPDPTAGPEWYLEATIDGLGGRAGDGAGVGVGAVRAAIDGPVDVVVHHEGEQTMVRLLDLVDRGDLGPGRTGALAHEPGVAFRSGTGPVVNQPRPPIEDLDELPLPARDLIDMDRYLDAWQDDHGYSSITIATGRGCPFGCHWCRDSVHGDGFRQRSPEKVAAEVAALAATYDVDRLRFVDDVDGIDRDWFERWAAESERVGAEVPFEPLSESRRADLPLLDARDSL